MAGKLQSSSLRVSFVALGCAKNLVDSEKMLALLVEAGFILVGSDDPADVTIINTCGFLEEARREAAENIERALDEKRAGRVGHVVVAGCLAQFWQRTLARQFPGIDAVVGLAERNDLPAIVKEVAGRASAPPGRARPTLVRVSASPLQAVFSDRARLRITEACWAYLRISEGCDRACTFCTIPAIRGPFRSKPLDEVLKEAAELVSDGALELNLIGQETSSYGADLGVPNGLATLLRELDGLDDLRWIRVLYAHPATLTGAQIVALAQCEKVVPYLDIPLQHINDRILKLMNRRITRAQTERLLAGLRQSVDGLTLRTTMLVGFPSETDAEFEELLDFVCEFRFEALGVFAYSPEEGTAAARMKDQIPEAVKQDRLQRLMAAQQDIAFEHTQGLVGRTLPCLLLNELPPDELEDAALDLDRSWYVARHAGQAPEIDSECYLAAPPGQVDSGQIVPARITGRRDYDLIGEV